MTKRIKRIAPLQLGKMMAVIYGLFSLLFIPFFLLFTAVASLAPQTEGAPPLAAMLGVGVGFMIMMPFLYVAMGFVTGAVGAIIYNLVAKWLGGIEIEVE